MPLLLPLLHRMEERAGERRRVLFAKISREATLTPSPPSDGGEGWGEEARSFVCKGNFAILSRVSTMLLAARRL